jgi:hypothetical protein
MFRQQGAWMDFTTVITPNAVSGPEPVSWRKGVIANLTIRQGRGSVFHHMKEYGCMRRRIVPASIVVFLASVLVNCSPFHRYQSAACEQRGAAYDARVEALKRDAHEWLRIGTKKEAVIRFFAENGIPVTFVGDEVTGTIYTTGCAPSGCGSDDALLGLRVKVDELGTVVSEPVVGALYTNCL